MSGPYVRPVERTAPAPRGMLPHTPRQDATAAVAVLLVGGALAVVAEPTWSRVLGGMLLVLGVTLTIAVVARHRRRPRPAPAVGEWDRVRATAVLRGTTVFTAGMVMAVEVTVFLAVAGVAALRPAWWPIGLALLGLAAWYTVPIVHWARGRYVAGGVWLTPEHVVHRYRGLTTTVAWDDVVGVTYDADLRWVLLLVPDDRARHVWTPGRVHGYRAARALEERVIRVEEMALDAAQLARVLASYRHYPAQRAELGTPVSLTRIESLARG